MTAMATWCVPYTGFHLELLGERARGGAGHLLSQAAATLAA